MKNSKVIESLGLRMLRWGSKRPVWVMTPPSWVVQHLEPLPNCNLGVEVSPVGKIGAWMIERSNPLAHIQKTNNVIKITLP